MITNQCSQCSRDDDHDLTHVPQGRSKSKSKSKSRERKGECFLCRWLLVVFWWLLIIFFSHQLKFSSKPSSSLCPGCNLVHFCSQGIIVGFCNGYIFGGSSSFLAMVVVIEIIAIISCDCDCGDYFKKRKANADSDHQHGGRSIAGSQLRLRKQGKLWFCKTQIFRSPARTSPTELLLPVQVPLFFFSSQKSFLSLLSLPTDATKKDINDQISAQSEMASW